MDISRTTAGAIAFSFSDDTPTTYLVGPTNVQITGKPQKVQSAHPVTRADEIYLSWSGGSQQILLNGLTIDGVEPDDLDDALLRLADEVFSA